ncbi:unnamed protein product, partial [Symbiodinium microadriaticum]
QWLVSSYGEDCDNQEKKDVIKKQYLDLLDIMQDILSQQPFLFGNHPTLVDFGFAGPFFRHFSSDFTPRKVMQIRAPAVYEWIARLWNCKHSKLTCENGFPTAGCMPATWAKLLPLLRDYLEYLHLNAVAYRDKKKVFAWNCSGQVFRVPVVKYRVHCRMKLQQHFDKLDDVSKEAVKTILHGIDCWDLLWKDGVMETEPECGTEPPFVVYPPPRRTVFSGHNVHNYKWDYDSIIFRYFGSIGFRALGVVAAMGAASWMLKNNKTFK